MTVYHQSPGSRFRYTDSQERLGIDRGAWLAVIFMANVVVTFFALQRENPPQWVNYLPLPWLFLLMFTGIYLFVLPYVTKRRN